MLKLSGEAKNVEIREFGIRDVRYVDYRVALVSETAIRSLSNLAQDSIVSYLEFTLRLMRVWHHLYSSFHSLSRPTAHLFALQCPSFIPHPISSYSEPFQPSPCYS